LNTSDTVYVVVNVADKTAPVPVVKRDIVVSLTSGGYDQAGNLQPASAKLFVESVDNGSHDNCTPVFMEIRRTKSPGSCNNLGAGDYNNNLTFRDLPCANPTKKIKSTDANGHIIYDYIGCTRAVPAGWTFDSWVPSTRFPGEYDCKDTDGGQWVKFCCADLEKIEVDANADGKVDALDKGYVEVQFRVWDDANKDGVYDCLDNYNDSWAFVKVECKLPPVITPPADATVYCDWPIETSTVWKKVKDADFSKTGKPWAYGPCGVLNDEVEFKDSEDFNKCGVGHIERQFRVTNWGITVYSRQHITVEGRKSDWSFYNDWPNKPCAAYYHDIKPDNYKYGEEYDTYTKNPTRINLAKEIGETTCDGPSDADIAACTPLYQAGPCDVIGINIKKWNFDFESGECRKWVVDYHFVNWCDHNEVIYRKIWTYNDETPPVMTKEDICIPAGTGTTTRCLTQLSHSKVATDNGCTSASTWIKWQVFLDINNDGVDDYLYSSFVPPHYNFGSDHKEKGLFTKYLAPTASGAKATITSPTNIDGPWSTHKITWKATDGCHNYAVIVDIVEVKDKKAPTPYCVPLSTALMAIPAGSPAGTLPMVEIWARDFDKGAGDNCYANGELYFTFFGWTKSLFTGDATGLHRNRDHFFDANGFVANASNGAARARYLKGELQLWRAADRQSAYLFTKVGDHNVRVDVTDPHQNSDWCMTTLKVICNNPTCPTSAGSRIAGTVKTASDQPVSNVTVTIDADITEYPVSVTTPATGAYEKEVPQGLDYSVTASKGGDYINGVSTMDLVMIQRHILGIQALDSPYKLIAADANNDGRVTAQDLTELRKLILGITNELSSNASWRFPVSAQTMNASNPFPFVEKIAISKMEADMTNQNFVAVKVGDVNGSVTTNVSNATVEARSNNNVVLAVAERAVEAGEVVEIPVSASNFADIAGFQYTMNVKGASVVSVNGGLLDITASNVGLISKDVMTMSYASTQGVTASENEVLFTFVVKAERAMKVSEMLAVSSTVTAAESYTSDLKVGKVSLDVRTAPVKAIELSQNEPNPFKGQTSISFMMPEAATATLSVYDVTGKVVTVRNINANKGMNSETFTREQLGASGVMYYTLKSGDFSATKKMFIVE
jgi:hypothetical protein